MFPSAALLSFVFLALSTSTSASPLARRAPVPDAGPSNNATSNAAPATNATAATTTLPFHTKFAQKSGGGHDIVAADVARIQAMMERGRQMRNSKLEDHLGETPGVPGAGPVEAHGSNSYNVPVTNAAVTYTADVGIGMPATQYTLLIDTGMCLARGCPMHLIYASPQVRRTPGSAQGRSIQPLPQARIPAGPYPCPTAPAASRAVNTSTV